MPNQDDLKHPTPAIRQFATKLERKTASSGDASAFEKFVRGPRASSEERETGERLLAEYRAMGPDAMAGANAQAARQRADQERVGAAHAARPGPAPVAGLNRGAAPASTIGLPFHNPYTFIPFGTGPIRRRPTLLSADESDPSRVTGVLELQLRMLSPLLSCDPTPVRSEGDHRCYKALTIGNDVIVPATGVRGALRTLMTILTGGTLGYLDETIWLCQGRDRTLGPRGNEGVAATPARCFLGKVARPGSATRSGELEIGETRLFALQELETQIGVERLRPKSNRRQEKFSYGGFEIKLSGRRVNQRGVQREGGFRSFDPPRTLTLPPELWAAYEGRHRHADIPDLRQGDLVWIEPQNPNATEITAAEDIASIQWARWGRGGKRLLDLITEKHPAMLPDAFNRDGKVDEVTDLFGHLPRADRVGKGDGEPAPAFAARVRPENLVFRDGAASVESVILAPLAPPHPGCVAFYRDTDDRDAVSGDDPLRGYKVYRTTKERGEQAPWHWRSQPVYNDRGVADADGKQKLNKSCALLKEGAIGTLRIGLRSLSRRELALLLLACSVDWRLGGGKPLGLGHARVTCVRLIDEGGEEKLRWDDLDTGKELDRPKPAAVPDGYSREVVELGERAILYQSAQRPVDFLRYPRAASENAHRKQCGGHVWFQRHAQPKKGQGGGPDLGQAPRGLQVLWTRGELQGRCGGDRVQAQLLPKHIPDNPMADLLYGHDGFSPPAEQRKDENNVTRHGEIVRFDPQAHARDGDARGGFHGQNRDTRRDARNQR